MERSTGEHGKGFFWSVDAQYEHTFEEQEARAAAQAQSAPVAAVLASGKDSASKNSRKKDKTAPLDPPLRRSVKSGIGPLPPPLTSALVPPLRSASDCGTQAPLSGQLVNGLAPAQSLGGLLMTVQRVTVTGNIDVGVAVQETKSEPTYPPRIIAPAGGLLSPPRSSGSSSGVVSGANVSTNLFTAVSVRSGCGPSSTLSSDIPSSSSDPTSPFAALPPSVCLPIVIGPVPSSHPSSSTPDPPPIVLHNNTLVLSPIIFSSLAPEQLKALEEMGAQKALEVLQGHIVRYLKERMGKKKRKKAVPGGVAEKGGMKTGKRNNPSELSSPFTTAPLPSRTAQSTPASKVQHPSAQMPSAAMMLADPSTFCTPVIECSAVEVKEGVPSPVGSSLPVPVPLSGDNRSHTSTIIVPDDDEEGRAIKRRKLGNEAEVGTELELEDSTTRISQAVDDEDIEVDVC